jgi:hypothetical protein
MSNTVKDMAREFVRGNRKLAHKTVTLRYPMGIPKEYRLHNNVIASMDDQGLVTMNWCGWYTTTTANHMNAILEELGAYRVSYAKARDAGTTTFIGGQA